MFKSQAECKSPKILSCLLRQNVLVWEHVFKITVSSGRRCIWIGISYNGVRDGCETEDGTQESDRKNESVSLQGPSTLRALAALQTSSLPKMRADLLFGSLGMETVWTQCALNSRSISTISTRANLAPSSHFPKHKQHEMKSYLMGLCGQMIEGCLRLKRIL